MLKQGHHSKKGGKDQESIQSSTTPDPGHHMRKWQKHNKTSHTREQRIQPLPSRWTDKKAWQTWNINHENDPQKKHHLVTVSKNTFISGLKLVSWRQPHLGFRCGSRHIDVLLAWKTPNLSMECSVVSQRIQDLLGAFFNHRMWYLMVSKNKNLLILWGLDLRITVCRHSASLVMPNGDLKDRFFLS